MVLEEEIVRILLTASATLTSVMVAVIGVLLSQYVSLKNKPEMSSTLKPYHRLIWVMVIGLVLGVVSTISCLTYLLNIDTFIIILALFLAVLMTVVVGVIYVVRVVLRENNG
jgi:hypothetical protein